MATYSSILAWSIPWTEEAGGLQCKGSVTKSQTQLKQLSTHTHARTHARTVLLFILSYVLSKELITYWELPGHKAQSKCLWL